MNSLRKLMDLMVTAVMLAAFALPSAAAPPSSQKRITLTVPATSTTKFVDVTINNTGNSNANSFRLSWAKQGAITVTRAATYPGRISGTLSDTATAGTVTFLYQLPTKTSVTIRLEVTVTDCATLTWGAIAWTGSPSQGDEFALEGGPYSTTWESLSCLIKFENQPRDAFIGPTSFITNAPFSSQGAPVTVKLTRNGVVPPTMVTVRATPGVECAIAEATALTNGDGVASFSTLSSNSAALVSQTCRLTASAVGYTPVPVSSDPFEVKKAGQLGCAAINNTFGTTGVNGTRLQNVADPSPTAVGGNAAPACQVVPYVLSTTCPAGIIGPCTNFTYDPLAQGTHMAFTFRWVWPVEDIPPAGIEAILNTGQLFLNGNPVRVDLDLCPEIIPEFAGNGTFIGLATGSPSPNDQDYLPTLTSPAPPGTQAGCLVRRVVQQVGGKIQIVEDAYVQGDYTATRR